jgi:hypothetical protein
MYWLYDLPNWLFGLITVGTFVIVSVAGLIVFRPLVHRLVEGTGKHNDVTSYYIAAVGVLYGLALGLIAVATYQNYSDADSKVTKEANAIGALFRDLDVYPQPIRATLEDDLRAYMDFIIQKEWPAHRRGEVPHEGEDLLETFEDRLITFEPVKEREKISHAQAVKSLDDVVEGRAYRLEAVGTALPGVLWGVVLIGAGITVGVTYLFWVENFKLHAVLVGSFAACLGLLVFLTAAMDNPFRGEFSVSPDAYESVLSNVMHGKTSASGTPDSP